MRKVIKASKYSNTASKKLHYLGNVGEVLSRVANAKDEGEVEMAMSDLGGFYSKIFQKDKAIHELVELIDSLASDYLLSNNADKKVPEVRNTIIDYLKGLGYDMTKMSNPPRGYDESYVIIPADECDFEDLKTVASAVAHDFGLRPDTGIIGGSWTSYEFKMDGVAFRIGFEHDKDFDPSGKELSLQFYL